MNKEIKTFLQLRRYLQTIPCINEGGCGIAALTMFRWLKQRGESSEIVFYYNSKSKKSFNANEACMGVDSCSHAYVKYKQKLYDTERLQTDGRLRHMMSESMVVKSVNNKKNWSSNFDRDFIPYIQKDTGVDLSDLNL